MAIVAMIITLLLIWLLRPFFRKHSQFLRSIKGHWLKYAWNRIALTRYRRENPKSRLDLHDINNTEHMGKIGMATLPAEVEYANPKLNQGEDLFIYGGNVGERTTIQVQFKRRPLPKSTSSKATRFDAPKDTVSVSFKLHDGQGNIYWMSEQSVVEFSPTEYRGSGFAFEAYEGNRMGRIKYRGYLKRNDESSLVYVQIRFLCISFSKTFDHQRQFDPKWLALELHQTSVGEIEYFLEDKIEQFVNIKGTFKVEGEEEKELMFLGSIGRRFAPKSGLFPRKIVRVNGFNRLGLGFQVGLIQSGTATYRYGYASQTGGPFKLMSHTNANQEELSGLVSENRTVSFDVNFEGKKVNIEVGRPIGHGRRLVKVNGEEGIGFVSEESFEEIEKKVERDAEDWSEERRKKLVVALEEDCARVTDLTGGKGASLAQLKKLSEGKEWTVPNAVVVTTSAFKVQTEAMADFEEKLEELEGQVIEGKNVEKNCETFVDWFTGSALNEQVQRELKSKMEAQFGPQWESLLLAVRSSASGEDSGEMSAAGQMTTYLGLSGLGALSKAVVACWASQFAFVPVTYKRGYGQPIGVPMAVVVQRIVDCQAAGVIFTAQPIDGDERILTVTSNFGLGESVVSAAAEPDTFSLDVEIRGNDYAISRKIAGIKEKILGKKALITRLNKDTSTESDIESGIQNETSTEGASVQSIKDEELLRLGAIALEIAAHYGNPRDLEWGLVDGSFYLFQSRPITALDSSFTNYELMHELDSAHMTEDDHYSRAHWGENFPGAASWLSLFFFMNGTTFFKGALSAGEVTADDFNAFNQDWGFMYNQLMFNLRHGPFNRILKDYPKTDQSKSFVQAMFGRPITDPDVIAAMKGDSASDTDENGAPKKKTWKAKFLFARMMFMMFFTIHKKIAIMKKRIFEQNSTDFLGPMAKVPLGEKLSFVYQFANKQMEGLIIHRYASMGSMFKSAMLGKALKSCPDTTHAEEDINWLMSQCNDVVSAEVPDMLKQIAAAIKDKAAFGELSDEEALEVLQGKSGNEREAALVFEKFLQRHGHRGYRELDPYHLPWGRRPLPVVQVVKSLLKGGSPLQPKVSLSVEEIMAKIKTPLTPQKRALIQYLLLPWTRDAVGHRENTKSMMVKFGDNLRAAMWAIAEEMVKVGYLPDVELFFFLKTDEIQRLLKGERNPSFVMKARQRKRLYPTMNAFKFDEFVRGFRMTPRPPKKEIITLADDSVSLSGTAVTVGAIKARVCVAETIEEAVNIQAGDILLTYSTDIGWSPYFPLISGICTEIGGTVSHGAVIAREFGIPCLIAVDDVCQYFKTGDIAYLDTKTGTIVKVKE